MVHVVDGGERVLGVLVLHKGEAAGALRAGLQGKLDINDIAKGDKGGEKCALCHFIGKAAYSKRTGKALARGQARKRRSDAQGRTDINRPLLLHHGEVLTRYTCVWWK